MKNNRKWLLFIPIILIVGFVGCFVLFIVMLASNHVDVKESFKEHYDKRNELIQLVETYQLEYDESGLLTNLDKVGLSGLADNDKVYVVYQEEKLVVEFVVNPGLPDDGQSIFYSSGGEKLIRCKLSENSIGYIEKIEDDWYLVQYN